MSHSSFNLHKWLQNKFRCRYCTFLPTRDVLKLKVFCRDNTIWFSLDTENLAATNMAENSPNKSFRIFASGATNMTTKCPDVQPGQWPDAAVSLLSSLLEVAADVGV